jgi:hypothetical protein
MSNEAENAADNRLSALSPDLAKALGEAVYSFSLLERQSFVYLRAMSTDPLIKILAGQSFAARVKAVSLLITDNLEHWRQDGHARRMLSLWDEALSLAKRRNLLAHTPWSIWEGPVNNDVRLVRESLKSTPQMTLDDVQAFIRETLLLDAALTNELADLRSALK